MECVTVFLTSSSHKEWLGLNLYECYIQDHGLHILHHGLLHCSDISIKKLGLDWNSLTTLSSSLISDITVKCKVKELVIDDNHSIGENEQLYSMLSDSSTMLEVLDMNNTQLSSRAAVALFNALKDNSKLKELDISHNAITDDACDAITSALERNNNLVTLWMANNPLTSGAMLNIVNGLKINTTLELLRIRFPKCPEGIKNTISFILESINKNRESQGSQVTLTIKYW